MNLEIIILNEIYHIKANITHVESKKKWHKWTYLQNRNRIIEVENKFKVTKEEEGGGINWEFWINEYTLLYIKQIKTYCIAQGIFYIL